MVFHFLKISASFMWLTYSYTTKILYYFSYKVIEYDTTNNGSNNNTGVMQHSNQLTYFDETKKRDYNLQWVRA